MSNIDFEKVGSRIKDRRENLGFTQEKLAETLGINRKTIIEWEKGNLNGKIDFPAFLELCAALKIDMPYLLGDIYSNRELETVCKYTGLSERAAEELHNIKSDSSIIQPLSNLLENHKDSFIEIITNINSYCINKAIHNILISIKNPDEITNDLALEHFNRASSAYSNCQLWITDIGHASTSDKFYMDSIAPYLDRILMDNSNFS